MSRSMLQRKGFSAFVHATPGIGVTFLGVCIWPFHKNG